LQLDLFGTEASLYCSYDSPHPASGAQSDEPRRVTLPRLWRRCGSRDQDGLH
jgi:hypothetical protein